MLLLGELLGFVLDLVGFLGDVVYSGLKGLVEGEIKAAEGTLLCDGEELLLTDLLRGPFSTDDLLFE